MWGRLRPSHPRCGIVQSRAERAETIEYAVQGFALRAPRSPVLEPECGSRH